MTKIMRFSQIFKINCNKQPPKTRKVFAHPDSTDSTANPVLLWYNSKLTYTLFVFSRISLIKMELFSKEVFIFAERVPVVCALTIKSIE